MNILLKNRDTLTTLFATFSLQEVSLINRNLTASWEFLTLPPEQILQAMEEKQLNVELFLGKKCLPLIRFYLADKKQQKDTFLSKKLLFQLFINLPAVEAVVFKKQIRSAQRAHLNANQMPYSQLSGNRIGKKSETKYPVIQLNGFQSNNNIHTKQSISQLTEIDKPYLNCFYYLNAGELFLATEEATIDVDMLLYSELSPLQQLTAQKMFKLDREVEQVEEFAIAAIESQSVSA